jgi:hypothetical protein
LVVISNGRNQEKDRNIGQNCSMFRIRRSGLRENQEITGLLKHHQPGFFQRDSIDPSTTDRNGAAGGQRSEAPQRPAERRFASCFQVQPPCFRGKNFYNKIGTPFCGVFRQHMATLVQDDQNIRLKNIGFGEVNIEGSIKAHRPDASPDISAAGPWKSPGGNGSEQEPYRDLHQ